MIPVRRRNALPYAFIGGTWPTTAGTAIESGCELATADRDFARFAGLRWRHPLTP